MSKPTAPSSPLPASAAWEGPAGKQRRKVGRATLALGAAAAVLLVAVALLALASGLFRGTTASSFDTRQTYLVADLVERHGLAMVEHGQQMVTTAEATAGQEREHWIADGKHVVADGQAMRALAHTLRKTADSLGPSPIEAHEVELARVKGLGLSLHAEGLALEEHGKVMEEHARAMMELAGQPSYQVLKGDAQTMARDSANMTEAGQQVVKAAQQLIDFAGDLERSLGAK